MIKRALVSSLIASTLFMGSSLAVAGSSGDGEYINHQLDRKGDRIDRQLDRASDRAAAQGKYGLSTRLDRKGDNINHRLDDKGNRIEHQAKARHIP